MYYANPISYAFQGLASNEFWGASYSCLGSELMPPTSVTNFTAPYPYGFEGKQTCPITSGTDYIVNNYGIFDGEWIKWVMAVCVMCWWAIFTLVTYIGLRWVRHSPPKKPRMKNVEISEEEAREMDDFNIKTVKAGYQEQKDQPEETEPADKEKEQSSADIEEASVTETGWERLGGEFIEGGAYLSWNHLNYSVSIRSGLKKRELQLLHDISGFVKPGMMLALMVSCSLFQVEMIF